MPQNQPIKQEGRQPLQPNYPQKIERQVNLTRLLSVLTQSDQLWHHSSAVYEEALLQTLENFCQNLQISRLSSPADWQKLQTAFNHALKQQFYKLTIVADAEQRMLSRQDSMPSQDSAAPVPSLATQISRWVKEDITGELQSTCLADRPAINCQTLIARRLPPSQSWEEISADFGIPIATLSDFYQRECLPRLRGYSLSPSGLISVD